MAENSQTVARRIDSQIKRGKLDDQVAVFYRLQGGRDEDAVDDSLVVTAAGGLKLKVDDRLEPQRAGDAVANLNRDDALELIRSLTRSTGDMVPAAQARFVPDSLVGSVTLVLGDETETYYFEADEDMQEHRGKSIRPQLLEVIQRVREVQAKHILKSRPAKGVKQKESR